MTIETQTSDGVAEVVIDFPPVNALPVQGWLASGGGQRGHRDRTRQSFVEGPRVG